MCVCVCVCVHVCMCVCVCTGVLSDVLDYVLEPSNIIQRESTPGPDSDDRPIVRLL